jgi:hypothetical protein
LCSSCSSSESKSDGISDAGDEGALPGEGGNIGDVAQLDTAKFDYVVAPYFPPGHSSVPLNGELRFFYSSMGSLEFYSSLLSGRANYLSDSGPPIEALVMTTDAQSNDSVFDFVAASTLSANQWYWIAIQESSELKVGPASGTDPWSRHVFTGSAPRIVGIDHSQKHAYYVSLTFSEHVDITQIDETAFVFKDGVSIAKCLMVGADCVNKNQPKLMHSVDVMLTGPIPKSALTFVMPGSLQGTSATVAEGALAAGLSLENGNLVVSLGETDWYSCQDGYADCWTEQRTLPAQP